MCFFILLATSVCYVYNNILFVAEVHSGSLNVVTVVS